MSVEKKSSKSDALLKALQTAREYAAFVGVPSTGAQRQGDPINNATLAYIHEHGSPANNIPARPFLKLGIAKAHPAIVAVLKDGALGAINGNPDSMKQGLMRAGHLAASGAQTIIATSEGLQPIKRATIRARARRRRGQETSRPLLDTGALRKSITFLVRKVQK